MKGALGLLAIAFVVWVYWMSWNWLRRPSQENNDKTKVNKVKTKKNNLK
jgi:hypothetical protein